MNRVHIVGKGGVFLIVKKGRLASGTEATSTFKEALGMVTSGDQVTLDPGAVALLKQEMGGV